MRKRTRDYQKYCNTYVNLGSKHDIKEGKGIKFCLQYSDGAACGQQNAVWFGGPAIRRHKQKRVRCPTCGRRMMARICIDHDGLDLVYALPPHKPKGWYKPKRKKRERYAHIRTSRC